eukprot:g45655.t1
MGSKEMTEEVDRYFAAVFTVEDTNSMPKLQESQGAEVGAVAITKEKVLGKLEGLKVDKPPRPNGLHPRVLKERAEEIIEVLMVIFQKSVESGKIPENWKKEVMSKLDKGEPVNVINLDFQKSFNKMPRFITMLGDIIGEVSDEAMLFYFTWNSYCLVCY